MEPTEVRTIARHGKLSHLDGLRGLAALIVVFHHYSLAFFPSIILGAGFVEHSRYEHYLTIFPVSLLTAGNFAVSIFFVLSGFVLTRSYFAKGDMLQIRMAALKRYVRLVIPVGVSVMLAYALLRVGLMNNQSIVDMTGSTDWLAGQWHFTAHFMEAAKQAVYGSLLLNQSTYNSSLWTIYFELLGSFLSFGLAVFARGMQRRYLLYLGAGLLAMQTWYFGFVVGVALADIWTSNRHESFVHMVRPYTWLIIFTGLVLGGYPQFGSPSAGLYAWLHLPTVSQTALPLVLHNIGAALLMVGVLVSAKITRVLQTRPFQFLGYTSFSAYLLHVIVLASFSAYLFKYLITNYSYMHAFEITLAVSLPLIYGTSYLYAKYVDQTAIRLANRFAKVILFGRISWRRSHKPLQVTEGVAE